MARVPVSTLARGEVTLPVMFRQTLAACAAAATASVSATGATLQGSQMDQVIHSRLVVSDFIRLCVDTDRDPDVIEGMLFDELWREAAPSDLAIGLNRRPPSDAAVYETTKRRATADGRRFSLLQIVVPVPGKRDCTLEFENLSFTLARRALEASGFDTPGEAENPTTKGRVEWVQRCRGRWRAEPDPRLAPNCVELAVDPAKYPMTGQLTLTDAGPEEGADDRGTEETAEGD